MNKVAGWANTHFSHSEVLFPKTVTEIQSVVEQAKQSGKKIIARGAGSSYGDQALNKDNIVLNMREVRKIISWDKEMGVLVVESGIMYSEVLPITLKDNWTLAVIPGTRYVTMGGALANNVHGKNSFNRGNFGDWVKEFKIIISSGELLTCSKETNSELFFSAIGGAGLLGIVVEITLQLEKIPSPYLSVTKMTAPNLPKLLQTLDELALKNNFAIAQVDCFPEKEEFGRGTIHGGSFISHESSEGNVRDISQVSKNIFGIFPKNLIGKIGQFFLNDFTMRLVSSLKYHLDKKSSTVETQDIFKFTFLLDQVPGWKKVFKNGFFEYEPLLPKHKARDIIPTLLKLTQEYKMPAYLSAIKIHRKDDFLISYSMDGYSFAMDIPHHPDEKEEQNELFRKMNEIVIEAGGIIYLAKDATMTRDEFWKMYNVDKFLEIKKKYDPAEIFQSDMYVRIFK